ncbi:hypothetical protein [Rubritalea sp.]|uniref:hypothetical protein n=1 Tax=Rubritalea sp. TaxID=2109375 RepID=UPI003EF26BF1
MIDTILEMLTTRGGNLIDRLSGPLNFRLFIMPLVVSTLAFRAHMKDVKMGNPTFLGAFLLDKRERRRLLVSGLKDFGRVFIFACVLDTIYQLMVLHTFYVGELLLVATTCAIVPYFLVRGPVLRLAGRLFKKQKSQG